MMTMPILDELPSTLLMIAAEPAEPVDTRLAHIGPKEAGYSAIVRSWANEARPTCGGLCESGCTFAGGLCLVIERGHVAPNSAALLAKGHIDG